ncbi:10084_t:CDS:2, partial [Paraglomus occultum]
VSQLLVSGGSYLLSLEQVSMSKNDEKESAKQKETKQKTDKKNPTQETLEKKKLENENPERLKKLEAEITNLKNDKLRLAAEIENERKNFRRQMEQVYKYMEEIENDNLPEGTITEVSEKGYLFADQ